VFEVSTTYMITGGESPLWQDEDLDLQKAGLPCCRRTLYVASDGPRSPGVTGVELPLVIRSEAVGIPVVEMTLCVHDS